MASQSTDSKDTASHLVAHRVGHDVDGGRVAGAGLHLALGDGDGALAVPAAHDFRGNRHLELDVVGHLGRDLDAADLVELGRAGVQDFVFESILVHEAHDGRARLRSRRKRRSAAHSQGHDDSVHGYCDLSRLESDLMKLVIEASGVTH